MRSALIPAIAATIIRGCIVGVSFDREVDCAISSYYSGYANGREIIK